MLISPENQSQGKCDPGAGRMSVKRTEWAPDGRGVAGSVLRERMQKMTRCVYTVPFEAMAIVPCLFPPKDSCELYNLP